jgi:curved DNA-binding protein CbpA
MKKTLYDILEVSQNASPEVIKAAYKSLVQKYHPDKNPGIPDADKLFKLINHAYEILSNPVRRAAHDAELGREGVHGPDSHNVEMGQGNNRANDSGGNNSSDGHEHNTPNQEEKWSCYAAMIGPNTVYYRSLH